MMQAGDSILIPDKIDFRAKIIKKSKEVHLIRTKKRTVKENITVLSVCKPSSGETSYITQKVLRHNTAH